MTVQINHAYMGRQLRFVFDNGRLWAVRCDLLDLLGLSWQQRPTCVRRHQSYLYIQARGLRQVAVVSIVGMRMLIRGASPSLRDGLMIHIGELVDAHPAIGTWDWDAPDADGTPMTPVDLPVSVKAEGALRKRLCNLVARHASAHQMEPQSVWHDLYGVYRKRTGIMLPLTAAKANLSSIEWASRHGHLDAVYALAVELFAPSRLKTAKNVIKGGQNDHV